MLRKKRPSFWGCLLGGLLCAIVSAAIFVVSTSCRATLLTLPSSAGQAQATGLGASVPCPQRGNYAYVEYQNSGDSKLQCRSCAATNGQERQPVSTRTSKRKIVSGNIYWDEPELLHVRFLEHFDTLDYFIIIEATETFQGNPKPLNFQNELCLRFRPFLSKIVHVVIPGYNITEGNVAWLREHASRDALAVAISLLDLQPTDIVLMSDLDEIPNASAIRLASNILWNGLHQGEETIPIVEFDLQCYYYSLWHMLAGWRNAKMFPVWASYFCSFQELRKIEQGCPQAKVIARPAFSGVHASYFFPPRQIANKLGSFAHKEWNVETNTNIDAIKQRIRTNQDVVVTRNRTMSTVDPYKDIYVMGFNPEARQTLLNFSVKLRQLQEGI